ncbi:MAG: sugar phosphate isomerase/epimerase family protein [Planctomycetota bacterium]
MSIRPSRRRFITSSLAAAGGIAAARGLAADETDEPKPPLFEISLAQWSLHKTLFSGKLDNLDFPRAAREQFGIAAVEYVNQFFKDKAKDTDYLADLAERAADAGVKNLLIMCDGLGNLGDPDDKARTKAVENHHPWVEAAKRLGCHSIRVNAASSGTFEEQQKLAADGLARLSEFAAQMDLNVIVENHGGLSSNGKWLAGVIEQVGRPNCGTLPDFGNFYDYDRYQGVAELMPFAKGVSAKSKEFDAEGNETQTDYRRMLKIVVDAGYRGWVGIEYEGDKLPEDEGIKATKRLLESVRSELAG